MVGAMATSLFPSSYHRPPGSATPGELHSSPASRRGPLASRASPVLAVAAQGGDAEAAGELFRRVQGRARQAAMAFCVDSDADDAVAEGLSRALQRIGQLRDAEAVEGWLLRCVVRAAIDLSRQRRRQSPTDAMAELLDLTAAGESAAERALEGVDRHAMAEAVQELPSEQRLLLFLRYHAGLSVLHIAAVLGRPAGTVRRQCLEARRAAGQRFLGQQLRPAGGACAQATAALCRQPYEKPGARVRRRTSEHLGRCAGCRARRAELDAVLQELGCRRPSGW